MPVAFWEWKRLLKSCEIPIKKIIIATVRLSDTTDKGNTTAIRNGIKKQLSTEIYNNAHIIHLRGGIDYSRLNFTHKTMMKLLYKKAVNLPEENGRS